MKYTSAEANKLLRKLNDDFSALLEKERLMKTFNAAVGEDPESLRPDYDYREVQEKLDLISEQIRRLKHEINLFNITHKVDGFDMTIDEMLVYIPQLTQKKNKLSVMKAALPKTRVEPSYGRQSNIIDYLYISYDLKEVEKDYEQVSEELSRAQLSLDVTNSRDTLDFDL